MSFEMGILRPVRKILSGYCNIFYEEQLHFPVHPIVRFEIGLFQVAFSQNPRKILTTLSFEMGKLRLGI